MTAKISFEKLHKNLDKYLEQTVAPERLEEIFISIQKELTKRKTFDIKIINNSNRNVSVSMQLIKYGYNV
jgi:hypothetical protein